MKTIKINEQEWKILSEYKLWGECKSFSETIALMDMELQTFIPKEHIWKRSSRRIIK